MTLCYLPKNYPMYKVLIVFLFGLISTLVFAQRKGEFLGKAIDCSQYKNYDCVIENLTQLIPLEKNKKKLSLYYTNLGIAQTNSGRANDAILSLNRAIENDEKYFLPYYVRAKTNDVLNNDESKIQSDLTNFLYWRDKKKIARYDDEKIFALGRLEKIDELNKELVNAKSDKRKIKIEIAKTGIKKRKKQFEEAVQDYLNIIEKYPNQAELYNSLADTYLKNRQIELGLEAVGKSIKLDSTYSTAYVTKGELLMTQNKAKEACENFNIAIKNGFRISYVKEYEFCK